MLKTYAVSLAMGILAGVIYVVIEVNSPAPPVIALLGLFGMLIGEQIIPLCKRLIRRQPVTLAWFRHECVPKISGTPPPPGEKNAQG
ncbi:XapX domain-containing protein [Enterobacter sp.]|uniref:XapX domain-containing protein n=1 Tax=Enterobacter sp. TaxID=42895 RepID=UPI00296F5F2F|nr:XapX domain-containing protein [Enterobacter sp.]